MIKNTTSSTPVITKNLADEHNCVNQLINWVINDIMFSFFLNLIINEIFSF